ncbi:MAG: MerR family transcriptional regulator [Armatimonadetes bacterium]|nr:MerR family transcriptional regulator [Armatimonadota bacterium]NIM24383.1 MerR family transcriptional regulator [Armatimonadota bacterium]NIM68252.1 MerR family transcriptional regulator [Armatimonadota bacterium]NIM75153.1 MerR family transcriptional regulator [Armatimonadota bacterium]NIN06457.1 MerR family transcriptional regulator [Armatimonadota bacterium]
MVKIPHNIPMYPMRTVVKLTGVEAHRIRYWENKYGMPRPSRDQHGHRLYTKAQVDLIKKIGGLADGKGLSLVAIWDLLPEVSRSARGSRTTHPRSSQ